MLVPLLMNNLMGQTVPVPPGTIFVPNVVGLNFYAAAYVLILAGLDPLQPIQAQSNSVQAGYVISQLPVADTMVTSGTAIQLTVSQAYLLSASFDLMNYQFGQFDT